MIAQDNFSKTDYLMLDSLTIFLFSSGVVEHKICETLITTVRQDVFNRFPEDK